MISNERPSPYGRRPYGPRKFSTGKPPVHEETLKSAGMSAERKDFVFLLRENTRGRFLRIIEQSGSKPSVSIIVPDSGLKEFQAALAEMVEANEK